MELFKNISNQNKEWINDLITLHYYLNSYKYNSTVLSESCRGTINLKSNVKFEDVTQQMTALYNRKNRDYDSSFDKSLDADGLIVAKIRIGDKYNRFAQLIKNDAMVSDESIEDTLIDLANYSVMTLLWINNNRGRASYE